MTTEQTPKAKLTSDRATLIDLIGMKIEMDGKTFTADWIDAQKQPDNGKIMIQSDETEVYYVGDKDESIFDAFIKIHSELRKEAKRKMNAGVHEKKVVE